MPRIKTTIVVVGSGEKVLLGPPVAHGLFAWQEKHRNAFKSAKFDNKTLVSVFVSTLQDSKMHNSFGWMS